MKLFELTSQYQRVLAMVDEEADIEAIQGCWGVYSPAEVEKIDKKTA